MSRLQRSLTLTLAVTAFASVAQAQTVRSGMRADLVVDDLAAPTSMAFLAPNDFFVLEKSSGMVKRVQVGGPAPVVNTVLDLDVSGGGEQGLLGIALPPDFAQSGTVFLYYTNSSPTQNRVARYTWDGSTLTNPVILATLLATAGNHNGGPLTVGPDGMLYAVIGDQERNDLTQNNTSSSTVLETGVVLRMNPIDGSAPADNPFNSLAGWQRIYAYGIRNCFGMAFDPLTGVLWEAENGPGDYDEVTRIIPGTNGGWTQIHGPDSRDSQNVSNLVMNPGATYVDPAFSWLTTVAPTGITFLHSVRWDASVRDQCVVASYKNSGTISLFQMNAARTGFTLTGGVADGVADNNTERTSVVWASGFGGLSHLERGPDGYLYAVSLDQGSVWRVRPQFPMGDINRDGIVNGQDVGLFVRMLTGQSSDPLQLAQSDFDGNSAVNASDVSMFVQSLMLPN